MKGSVTIPYNSIGYHAIHKLLASISEWSVEQWSEYHYLCTYIHFKRSFNGRNNTLLNAIKIIYMFHLRFIECRHGNFSPRITEPLQQDTELQLRQTLPTESMVPTSNAGTQNYRHREIAICSYAPLLNNSLGKHNQVGQDHLFFLPESHSLC